MRSLLTEQEKEEKAIKKLELAIPYFRSAYITFKAINADSFSDLKGLQGEFEKCYSNLSRIMKCDIDKSPSKEEILFLSSLKSKDSGTPTKVEMLKKLMIVTSKLSKFSSELKDIEGLSQNLDSKLFNDVTFDIESCNYAAESLIRNELSKPLPLKEKKELFFTACTYSSYSIVAVILNHNPTFIAEKDQEGRTGLMHAAIVGSKEKCMYLVKKRADVKEIDNQGYTALHRSAHNGSASICNLLIDAGADVNARPQKGYTPLNMAAISGNADLGKALISFGARLEPKMSFGEGTRVIARRYGNYNFIREIEGFNRSSVVEKEAVKSKITKKVAEEKQAFDMEEITPSTSIHDAASGEVNTRAGGGAGVGVGGL